MIGKIRTRSSLIDALSQAAELEHALCCTYLYAAFSLKKYPDDTLSLSHTELTRDWMTIILVVARQEMEHLGMVCNLLTSIGGAPDFHRPNFPQPARYFPTHIKLELEPFSETALQRFICFERPEGVEEPHCHADHNSNNGTPAQSPLFEYHTLQQLYEEIRAGFAYLNNTLGPNKLFIGPTNAQVMNETLFDESKRVYSVKVLGITDENPGYRLQSAVKLIDAIVEEGEGSPEHREGSHYWRFKQIDAQLKAEMEKCEQMQQPFQPAKNVVTNPYTYKHSLTSLGTPITEPFAYDLACLFNKVYETTLLMLIRFYGHTDETKAELEALQDVAFFPLMTMGIRPLAELLTEIPAQPDHPRTFAGPPFELHRPLHFLPHKENAWAILHELLQQIAAETHRLSHEAKQIGLAQHHRLTFIANNLTRNAQNFETFIKNKEVL